MPCAGPDRRVVGDALGVVPHPVAVDHPAAGPLGDAEHPPVDVEPGTPESIRRARRRAAPGQFRRTRSWLPPMPPEVTMTACAAELEVADHRPRSSARPRPTSLGSRTSPRDPGRPRRRRRSARSTRCRNRSSTRPRATARRPAARTARARPGPVPQVMWKRGTELPCPLALVAAALGPAARPGRADALRLAARRASRPRRTPRRPRPTAAASGPPAGRSRRCPASPARASSAESLTRSRRCSGRVDQEQPAEGPPGLAAEAGRALLVEHDHPRAGVGQLGGGHQPGQPGPDDDDVRVRHAPTLPHRARLAVFGRVGGERASRRWASVGGRSSRIARLGYHRCPDATPSGGSDPDCRCIDRSPFA